MNPVLNINARFLREPAALLQALAASGKELAIKGRIEEHDVKGCAAGSFRQPIERVSAQAVSTLAVQVCQVPADGVQCRAVVVDKAA